MKILLNLEMKKLALIFLLFSSFCFSQEFRIDTIRYFESNSTLATPLKIEITYRGEDLKKPTMKILEGSYVGNIKWLVPTKKLIWLEKDLKVPLSRKKLREILEEIKKINVEEIMLTYWEYEEDWVLDGTSSGLYFSNWFENGKPLDLDISNPDLDMEERKLTQYYKVLKLIEDAVMY